MASGFFNLCKGSFLRLSISAEGVLADTREPAKIEPVPSATFLTKLLRSKVDDLCFGDRYFFLLTGFVGKCQTSFTVRAYRGKLFTIDSNHIGFIWR